MKKHLSKKGIALVLAAVLAVGAFAVSAAGAAGNGGIMAIGTGDESSEIPATGITLNQVKLNLEVGATGSLTATVEPEGATGTVSWTSSDPKVAGVSGSDKTATVTAVGVGTAVITAEIDGQTATCNVEVIPAEEPDDNNQSSTPPSQPAQPSQPSQSAPSTPAPNQEKNPGAVVVPPSQGGSQTQSTPAPRAKKLTVNTKKLNMYVGQEVAISKVIKVDVKPASLIDQLKWTSNKPGVITVKNGKLIVKKAGTVKLTAMVGGRKVTVKVRVGDEPVKAKSVSVNRKKMTLDKGQKKSLKVNIKPATSTDNVKYSSSNPSVVKVDKFGNITAKKRGTATITIKAGKKTTTCKITVD